MSTNHEYIETAPENGGRPQTNASERKFKGTNLKVSHVHNQRVVLETVRLRGPISRAEISDFTALTPQTISNIVDKLLDRGVLQTIGRRTGRRGQPALELDINPFGGYGIGVHLDRDLLTVVLLDLSGVCHQSSHHTWNFPTPDEAVPLIVSTVKDLIKRQGLSKEDLWGVGVALPGPLDLKAGKLVNPPNFPGWDGIPLRSLLSEQLHLPVFLETDATAAAEGERWFGKGKGIDDYFYVYFSIGLGGGMIVNGQPYLGAFGNAGMLGHLPVNPDGVKCPCGGTGCLELYVSLTSLYKAIADDYDHDKPEVDLDILLAAGDRKLMAWLQTAAGHLTTALITLETLLSPSAVIFGGHLPAPLLKWLIDEIEIRISRRRTNVLLPHPILIQSEIFESAAALGAATLPLFSEFALVNSFAEGTDHLPASVS
jgi:predicted NBD/HSP70 family sugar kinase